MSSPQDLLREYVALNKKRVDTGISPLEYQRWIDLAGQLARAFPGHPPLGQHGKTRIVVSFRTLGRLERAVMMNVRPVGLFVNTPFAPDRGTQFVLRVRVEETSEVYESSVVVVSNNVGPDFSTAVQGMGLKFVEAECPLRALLDQLCGVGVSTGSAEAGG